MTTETSIYEYAKQGLALSADKPAIWFYGKCITYRELFEKIDNVADHLYQRGVREGTVVTIHLPNCPQAVMAIYAVAKLGGICNMVHPLLPEAALQKNMAFTESKLLITHLAICGPGIIQLIDFSELETPCSEAVIPSQANMALRCAFYLHSSGTTASPKTVMISHAAMNNCVENTVDFFEKRDMADQICLGALPLFHGFGLAADVHRNVHFGSTLVIMSKWNPKEAVELIKQHQVTLFNGVPAMFHSILKEPAFCGEKITQLRYCYTGGDTVSQDLILQMSERVGSHCGIFPGFGLTEATTMNCVNTWKHYKPGSAGFPVRNTSIAVMQEDGSLAPCGIGELVISSSTLMMGYYKDEEATKETLFWHDGKLWTHTGDKVEIDEDGFLFYKDRLKNVIIHNGYNIYPHEVEEVIRTVSGVVDVCVVSVQNEHTQTVRAVVVGNKDGLKEAIHTECLRQLPAYAVPKDILFVDSFPKNEMGKINRKELSRA